MKAKMAAAPSAEAGARGFVDAELRGRMEQLSEEEILLLEDRCQKVNR